MRPRHALWVLLLALVACSSASSSTTGTANPGASPSPIGADDPVQTSAAAGASGPSPSHEDPGPGSTTETLAPPLWVSADAEAAGTGRTIDDPISFSGALRLLDDPTSGVSRLVLLPGDHRPIHLTDLHGTPEAPILLEGTGLEGTDAPSTVTDNNYTRAPAIAITDSSHIEIRSLTVEKALFGVMIANSSEIAVVDVEVRDIGQEGIHVRDGSHDITIEHNRVHDTGRRPDGVGQFPAGFAPGEGIYIGTGSSEGLDEVWNVSIRFNEIFNTTHEAIDVKVPAHHISIENNHIHHISTFTSGAVVVHIDGFESPDAHIVIADNLIHDVTRTSAFSDGNCVVVGTGATISGNTMFACQHRAVLVYDNFPVAADRTVTIRNNQFDDASSIGAIEVREGSTAEVVKWGNQLIPDLGNQETPP